MVVVNIELKDLMTGRKAWAHKMLELIKFHTYQTKF